MNQMNQLAKSVKHVVGMWRVGIGTDVRCGSLQEQSKKKT